MLVGQQAIHQKLQTLRRWYGINLGAFVAAFALVGLLIRVFPGPMLRLYARWAGLMSVAGARTAAELGTAEAMFRHILVANGFTALIYFGLGLLLQAPFVYLFAGPFYAMVSLTAPWTMGRAFGLNDWLLVVVEAASLLLAGSLSSALAGDAYQVSPSLGDWLAYWRRNWKRLYTPTVRSWREVAGEWWAPVLGGLTVVWVLLWFVAWFETYGY